MENQNHIHAFEKVVVPATCQQQGYTLHRCSCGYEYKDQYRPAGTHDFQVAEQTEPTCTTPGQQTLKCKNCGATEIHPVAALGHNFGQWHIETMPTCTKEGSRFNFCDRCGHRENQVIKAKGHTFTNPRISSAKKGITEYFCPDCGQMVQKTYPFGKYKKLIVAIATILAVVLLAIFLGPTLKKEYNYQLGKKYINNGQYENAYYALQNCVDKRGTIIFSGQYIFFRNVRYYKDTQNLLKDFRLLCTFHEFRDGTCLRGEQLSYNKSTNRLIKTAYHGDIVDYRHEYEYDQYGNVIRAYYGSPTCVFYCTYDCEYDKDGRITQKREYNKNGSLAQIYEYKYNLNGNEKYINIYDASGELEEKIESEYDSHGNWTRYTRCSSTGEIWEEYKITCNLNGTPNKIIGYEEFEQVRSYDLEYDSHGNLISQIFYNTDGDQVVKRTITDYEVVYIPALGD